MRENIFLPVRYLWSLVIGGSGIGIYNNNEELIAKCVAGNVIQAKAGAYDIGDGVRQIQSLQF